MVRFPREEKGRSLLSCSAGRFSGFINDIEFVDLPLTGSKYMGFNNQESNHEQN